MKLCFVSENGARETYFVDSPRIMFTQCVIRYTEKSFTFIKLKYRFSHSYEYYPFFEVTDSATDERVKSTEPLPKVEGQWR
jgi:hypothetical protein